MKADIGSYEGYGDEIAREEIEGLTPLRMWSDFISQRRPVLISGHIMDAGFTATAKWDIDYMKSHAGPCEVMVEKRDKRGYGQGKKVEMTFDAFVSQLSEGREDLYLSTQDLPMDPSDGHPVLLAPPLTLLSKDFVRRPDLVGHLAPQSINVWMGSSSDGSSSGLHVDFHDNLYLLMRGMKKVRLFPPSLAPVMLTHGKVKTIHPNGRLVFEGQGDILPDGSDARDVKVWEERMKAEGMLQEAEAAFEAAENDETRRGVEEANERLEALLDMELEAALGIDDMGDDEGDDEGEGKQGSRKDKGKNEIEPPSFSLVDLNLDPKVISRKHPDFPLDRCIEVEVVAGQMLYIPCGWFHEVRSYSAAESLNGSPANGSPAFHCALNYWFHPPDNLDPTSSGFKEPYSSGYLPSLCRDREAMLMHHDDEGEEADEEDGEDEGEDWVPDENDLNQAGRDEREVRLEDLPEEERDKIREAIMQMMMGRGQREEAEGPKGRVFREYKRPIGRRHHRVMFVERERAQRGPKRTRRE